MSGVVHDNGLGQLGLILELNAEQFFNNIKTICQTSGFSIIKH